MKLFLSSVLIAFLFGCAPGVFKAENWVQVALFPSNTSRERSCDLGYQAGQRREVLTRLLYNKKVRIGELRFSFPVTSGFLVCYSAAIRNLSRPIRTDRYETFAVVETVSTNLTEINAYIELLDNSGLAFAKIPPSSKSNPDVKTMVFNFNEPSTTELQNFEKATGFFIVIDDGKTPERVRIQENDILGR